MKARLEKWLTDSWYGEMYLSPMLVPLSLIYADIVRCRRFFYRIGLFKTVRLPVPVIIVGNITVGGSGKTPLVVWIVDFLKQQGYKPGVVSRGYGGAAVAPQLVAAGSDPTLVGDEAVLLSGRCACPLAIGRNRPAAAQLLVAQAGCNIIVADDGLQHYALQRDVEIIVIDGQRGFGNGYCLPAGPLREPQSRLLEADLRVVNGCEDAEADAYIMQCRGQILVNLVTGEQLPLSVFSGRDCVAIAGIGNPQRFFLQLAAAGLKCRTRAYPDHYAYSVADLQLKDDNPVIMTEKDAVKCRKFAKPNHWYLPVTAELPPAFAAALINLLANK